MSSISIVEYMHDLKEAGFTDRQSEVQARKLELVISDVKSELKKDLKEELHLDELTTKKDLELAIEKIRYETLKFTVWTGVAVVTATAGMLAKGFHWF